MRRYKLVRLVNGQMLSANQYEIKPIPNVCLEYKVGEVTSCDNKGVACYKRLKDANKPKHIDETQHFFNNDKPIAIIIVEPIGRSVFRAFNYGKGDNYEGGINYPAVKTLKTLKIIEEE